MTKIDRILEKLINALGADNVLVSPEHLYVYSRSSGFGTKAHGEPVAVIKADVSEKELRELIGDEIAIVRNDDWASLSQGPYLLLDNQKPVTIKDLENSLAELKEGKEARKKGRREALSFHHWATSELQGRDGFRLSRSCDDKGFCVVQGYFGGAQTFSSKGRLLLARGLLAGDLEPSPLLMESLYSCSSCGQCYDQISLDSLEINNAIIKARNKLAEQAEAPRNFELARECIQNDGNPMGLPSEDRVLWIEEEVDRHPYADNPVLYWPGCITSYRLPELVQSTCHILERAGYDFGLLGEREGCCGLLLYLSGDWDAARSNAERVVASLGGVKRLVTNCAGCYYAFSRLYPQLGVAVPFEVVHTTHIIKESLIEGKLKLKEHNGVYSWHDPCDLGRHCGVYEPPRYVLGSIPGLSLAEHPLNQEHTVCCGAGGGLWMYDEEVTNHVSHQKLTEAIPENIDGIITGCPTCILSMRNTAREHSPNLKILDIVELVENCMI